MLAIIAARDFELHQIDIKIAFLYNKIEEEVFIEYPLRINSYTKPNLVYRLNKAFYGLKQSPRV